MELRTIGQVSRAYGVSTRMLRYYEQVGLIESQRQAENSYRLYNAPTLKRLGQIVILRKLQIPVRQIGVILDNPSALTAIDLFKQNIAQLQSEITALTTIQSILERFVDELERTTAIHLNLDWLQNDSVMELAETLSLAQRNIKENFGMSDLIRADKQLSKLENVRIIYLPPMTVAASHFMGENPESHAVEALDKFVQANNLPQIKPDLRFMGFDNPTNPYGDSSGYEAWVSIPEDMDVPAPLIRKKFHGGLYAAHATEIVHIDHWLALQEWVNDSVRYQSDAYSIRHTPMQEGLNGYMEEQINFFSNIQEPSLDEDTIQLDLLLPVKPTEPTDKTPIEIEKSVERCGYRAHLIEEGKFKILGFSTFIPFDAQGDVEIARLSKAFWQELNADGRLAAIQTLKKEGAPVFCFSSYDNECNKHNGWRFTICLRDSDVTDMKAFKVLKPFIKQIDASGWLRFEMPNGTLFEPHDAAPKLGFHFNGPISGYFDVLPGGDFEKEGIKHCWFPVK